MLTDYPATMADGDGDKVRKALATLVARQDKSLRALSQLLERKPGYLNDFIKKRSPVFLDTTDAIKLAGELGVPPSELGVDENIVDISQRHVAPSAKQSLTFDYRERPALVRDLPIRGHTRAGRLGLFIDQGEVQICLDDIWQVSKAKEARAPRHWRQSETTKRLELELLKKVRISDLKGNTPFRPVAYAKRGRGQTGTYAHPILAAAYAGYLSPKLKIEMLEVWLRFRAGDATLADEILERASPEANLWAATRAMGRAKRRGYTDALKSHGVVGGGYAICTNAIYTEVLGATTSRIKIERKLPAKANLRDEMSTSELAFVAAAEALAADRIEEEDPHGNVACARASRRSASFIRQAIERDKRDRQRPLV